MDNNPIFEIKLSDRTDRGNYYHNTQRIVICLPKHESLEEIYDTIQHECIHHAINVCDEEIDEDQEEVIIRNMSWANLSLT